jgi:regulator of sirC expression with transglutaminase-like and TPR domain
MYPSEARERFRALVQRDDPEIDLLEAALLIAQEEYPESSVEEGVNQVERMAERLARYVDADSGLHNILYSLNHLLFREMGFRGNTANYDEPENSMLNRVLARRKGIPITLSLLYREVLARGTGIQLVGVDFPGHFLLSHDSDAGNLYVDAFHRGRPLLEEELGKRLQRRGPNEDELGEQHLRRASNRRILTRMLANLKALYARRRDVPRTLKAVERLVLLGPEIAEERRDRGILYGLSGHRMAAIADLEDYLTMRPEADDAEQVRRRLERLHRQGRV